MENGSEMPETNTQLYDEVIKGYFPNGMISDQRFYKDNKLLKWITYYPTGYWTEISHLSTSENLSNSSLPKISETLYSEKDQTQVYIIYYSQSGQKVKETHFNGSPTSFKEIFYDSLNKKKYEGGTKEGKYDGKGLLYENGVLGYDGHFKSGLKEGFGKSYFTNSQQISYKGSFLLNKRHGYGMLFYVGDNNIIRYKGHFVKNFFEGRGQLFDSIGNKIYEGFFKKNSRDGQGISFLENNKNYEGWFKDDMPDGIGKEYYTVTQKVKYSGHWNDGILIKAKYFNRNGRLIFDGYYDENGVTPVYGKLYERRTGFNYYIGYTKNQKPHGIGTKYYENSDKFCKGKWEHGQLIFYELSTAEEALGYKSFNYDCWNIYVGQSENRVPNGYGRLICKDNEGSQRYEGTWKDGRYEGFGVEYNPIYGVQCLYSGMFKNGRKDSLGRYYDFAGILRFEGLWRDNNPIGANLHELTNIGNFNNDYVNILGNININEGPADRRELRGDIGLRDEESLEEIAGDLVGGDLRLLLFVRNPDGSIARVQT